MRYFFLQQMKNRSSTSTGIRYLSVSPAAWKRWTKSGTTRLWQSVARLYSCGLKWTVSTSVFSLSVSAMVSYSASSFAVGTRPKKLAADPLGLWAPPPPCAMLNRSMALFPESTTNSYSRALLSAIPAKSEKYSSSSSSSAVKVPFNLLMTCVTATISFAWSMIGMARMVRVVYPIRLSVSGENRVSAYASLMFSLAPFRATLPAMPSPMWTRISVGPAFVATLDTSWSRSLSTKNKVQRSARSSSVMLRMI
mmetsp:Transcript_1770/g.3260  ORF Transcript_1770/g.3260 Transcript_1770/m.3260 type:complete len:252 (+) Transcript_1770:3701-4456(+)